MVIESNTLDFIFLKDGEQGAPGDPGENGKTLYTWIKYSQNPDGSDMTDDPDNAIYIGLAYNKESATESTNPSDYSWSKFKGSDAYTIILTNENISFATDKNGIPLSNQSQTCEVIVLKGTDVITNFTIGTLTSVTGISTSVSNRVITLSTNTSTAITFDSGEITVPITIDGVKFSKVITYSISKQGESGIDAKSLDLYSSSYTVAFDSSGSLKDTSNITLTVNQQNYSDSITWSTNPSVTLGTVSGNSYQRTLSPSIFNNNDKIQITVSSGDLSDFITIVKVQDGDNGEDAYTIILSNESHTFVGDENAALESSTKCDVIAFKGTIQMPVTIGTISGLPTGMTASISNNGTMNTYFSPTVTTSMTSKNGTLTIPITVDGVSFTKYFSYALALKGDAGTNGISVSSVEVYYYLSTSSTELIGGSWSTERPTWVDGKYIWSKQKTTLSNGSSSETDPVCITGGTGATGETGRGVESITTEYYLSTSKTEQTGGSWIETQPEWSSGHYVWTRSKIVYNNPTSIEYTTPICDTTWEAMQAQIDTVTQTIADVELKVDKNTKSITEKVWQTDITDSINNYDGTTAKAIRDRVSKTETDINGITSEVSDIKTTVSKKADGSTVSELEKTVATNKQEADGFRATVEKDYATKDSLNNYATTSQVTSAIEQKANIILGTVTDSEGHTTTYQGTLAGLATKVQDSEDRMTMIEQTSEEISLKAGKAEKLAIESKTLNVNLSVEAMNVATDIDGNNGSYSNCKTTVSVSYGIEDVTAYSTITCTPSIGVTGNWNATSKVYTITNMTVDNGLVEIQASYKVTIDGEEKTLTNTKTFSVSKSKQGATGNSISVISEEISYQRSSSGTEIPTGAWDTTILERENGVVVSTKLDSDGILVYSDGATLDDDGVLIIEESDSQAYTKLSGDNTLITQDNTQDLKYLWTRTVTNYSDGNSTTSYIVSCDGDNGNGIESYEISYQTSTDGNNPPTGTWLLEMPIVGEGEYLWTRTVNNYSDGTSSTSYSVGKIGEQGVSVSKIIPEYYLSTSDTEVTGGSWTETPPVKTDGTYIWKREHTLFDDGTEAYSSAVLDASLNKLFEVTAELKVNQDNITAEIKDAKGSSTTLKARLEGIETSVVDAETNAKSFATQEADRIQSTVTKEYKGYVDGIKYGVRNLLRDTADLTKWKAENSITVTKEDGWFKVIDSSHNSSYYGIYTQISNYEQNTDYTVSVDIKYGNCKAALFIGYGSFGSAVKSISEEGFGRFEYTFNTGENTKFLRVYLAIYPKNSNDYGYFKLPKLEKGNRATDWSPAPEDIESTIGTVESNIAQRADSIELNVSKKKDSALTAIRYIRDWLKGSSVNSNNHWVECKVISNNVNIVDGFTATLINTDGTKASSQPSSIGKYTDSNTNIYDSDGNIDTDTYVVADGSDWNALELDLGEVYKDIDYIQTWHYYDDNRVYNHKLEVSSDRSKWYTLYDSDIQGGYAESDVGKVHDISNNVINEQLTSFAVRLGEIESNISDGLGKVNQSISTAEGNMRKIVNDSIDEAKKEINGSISELPTTDKVSALIEERADRITTEMTRVTDDLTTRVSKVEQDSDKWSVKFAELGMGEADGIETIIKLSAEGIRVSQSDGSEVLIDTNGLQGLYNNLPIFQLKKDLTVTERVEIANGADFTSLKYINREYQTPNGTVKCLVHVVSGGSS